MESNIYQKLVRVKKQVDYLKKDTKGFNYEYVSPELILSEINPLLLAENIVIIPAITKIESEAVQKKSGLDQLYKINIDYILIDADNPTDKIVCAWFGAGCNGDEKGVGSALTYALRYFLLQLFQIPTGKDDPDARQENEKKDTFKTPNKGQNGQRGKEFFNKAADNQSSNKKQPHNDQFLERLDKAKVWIQSLIGSQKISIDLVKQIIESYGFKGIMEVKSEEMLTKIIEDINIYLNTIDK